MLIPDEMQVFQVGDEVKTITGQTGIVERVSSNSVYYEHRPIASYTEYVYVVCVDNEKLYLKAEQIVHPQE